MIPFHRLLIATAICFCLGFAAWSFAAYRSTGRGAMLALALVFVGASALLGYYLAHLNRFLHR